MSRAFHWELPQNVVRWWVFWIKKRVRNSYLNWTYKQSLRPWWYPCYCFVKCCLEPATPLERLFQISFDKGLMPAMCKVSDVIPCYKKGGKHSLSNYRPIYLLSVLSKVMERLIHEAVFSTISTLTYKLISNHQFGFRAGHTTSDVLTYVS
jgi:hypothetical protein